MPRTIKQPIPEIISPYEIRKFALDRAIEVTKKPNGKRPETSKILATAMEIEDYLTGKYETED